MARTRTRSSISASYIAFTGLWQRTFQMESTRAEQQPDYSAIGVYALPGEPAIVIVGVPDIIPSDNNAIICTTNNVEPMVSADFWERLEGREVRKLVGTQYYSGAVTEFDEETGWYKVVYEDGDFEDL